MPRQLPQGHLSCVTAFFTLVITSRLQPAATPSATDSVLVGSICKGPLRANVQKVSVPSRVSETPQSQEFNPWKSDFHAARGAARADVKPDTPGPGKVSPLRDSARPCRPATAES